MEKLLRACLLCVPLLLTFTTRSRAQMMYCTNEPGQRLLTLNYGTGAVTTVYNVGGKPDSLIIYPPSGQIFYTVTSLRLLAMFDPKTGTNTVLANFSSTSPIPGYPRDLILEPNGTTILVGLYAPGKIVRYNIVTGALSTLSRKMGTVDGLAYDPSGNLFAVANRNTIVQIDPVSGLIVKTLSLEPHVGTDGADGLTYDSYSGQLWATTDGSGTIPGPLANGLVEVPTDLSGFTAFQTGKIQVPDGIVSDGNGDLYIGAGLAHVLKYNIQSDTITGSVKSPGVDDIALIPGTY